MHVLVSGWNIATVCKDIKQIIQLLYNWYQKLMTKCLTHPADLPSYFVILEPIPIISSHVGCQCGVYDRRLLRGLCSLQLMGLTCLKYFHTSSSPHLPGPAILPGYIGHGYLKTCSCRYCLYTRIMLTDWSHGLHTISTPMPRCWYLQLHPWRANLNYAALL